MEVRLEILLLLLIIHTKSAPLSFRHETSLISPCEGDVGCGEDERIGFGGVERLPRNVERTTKREASGFNTMLMPGLGTIRRNSSVVMTTEDLRDRLKPGDLVRLNSVTYGERADVPAHEGLLTVKAVTEHGILLEKRYESRTITQAKILKQILGAEFEIDRIREETRQRALDRLGREQLEREGKLALKISERHLRDAIVQDMTDHENSSKSKTRYSKKKKSPCDGQKYLSATFDVRHGSPLVFTSQDVRHEVRVGDVVRFDSFESYAIWYDPRDSGTMTLSKRYEGNSNTTSRACVVEVNEVDDVGCVKLQDMCFEPFENDMKIMKVKRKIRDETTPAVMAGETIRFTNVPSFDLQTSNRGSFSTEVLNPSNGTSLRLSETLPSSSSSPDCLEACLVQNTWSGGLVPLSCGTASLVRSSPIVMTTCDMSMYLSPGDFVRVGTRVTPIAEVTSTSFVMTVRHDEASQSGVRVSKQREVASLSGSVNVSVGSSRVYTSFDLRDEIFPNDVVKLLGSKNKYTVISPITKNYISLARNLTHDDAENSSMLLLKVLPLMIEGGVPLSGLCTAQNGARSMYVTTDLRADLDKGDTIAVDTFRALVLEVGPSKIDLDRPYDLNSASGLVLYKVETPSSMKDLLGLEHGLADCDTLYCMAMKELGMSGMSFDLFQRDDEEEKENHAESNTTNNTTTKPISGLDDDDKETSEMDEKMRRLRKIMQKGGIDAVEGADDVLRSIAESKTLGEIPDPDAVLPGSEDVGSDDLPTSNSDTYVFSLFSGFLLCDSSVTPL